MRLASSGDALEWEHALQEIVSAGARAIVRQQDAPGGSCSHLLARLRLCNWAGHTKEKNRRGFSTMMVSIISRLMPRFSIMGTT